MGMFDDVNAPDLPCRECGELVSGWQSKDAWCTLDKIELKYIDNFYAECSKCGTWNDYYRKEKSNNVNDFKVTE